MSTDMKEYRPFPDAFSGWDAGSPFGNHSFASASNPPATTKAGLLRGNAPLFGLLKPLILSCFLNAS